MAAVTGEGRSNLRQAVGPSGFFTLALGAMVGSGWVVVLGDWLAAAAPGGVLVGFAAGGAAMICIALCYGELAGRSSRAGGEFLFVLETLGRLPAFLVGWFLLLFAVAVCAFESVVLGTLVHALAPSFGGPTLYAVGATRVDAMSLGVGLAGGLVIGLLHARGAESAIRFQNIVTYGFVLLMVLLVAVGLLFGSPAHLAPLFRPSNGGSWTQGAVWMYSLSAFFLNGWQSGFHALEERRADVDVRHVVRAIVFGIVAATLLYAGIVLAAASATPWQRIVGLSMPARSAFDALVPGAPLGVVVLLAAAVAVAKTWSAIAWFGSRLAVALARHRMLPDPLARLDAGSGAPRHAILAITVLSFAGPVFGRGALLPMIDMVSICLALSILVCLVALLKQRRSGAQASSYPVPGGMATIATACLLASSMVGIALVSPILAHPGEVPVEWLLIGGWALGGGLYYAVILGRLGRR